MGLSEADVFVVVLILLVFLNADPVILYFTFPAYDY